ncbi:RNA ligase family protein [Chamaesiphon sp.]|uniref:RNA ligase family protein n=1 Tax=Chamaesiphon sp. TaxID=2814140 RepID=UPI003592FD6A
MLMQKYPRTPHIQGSREQPGDEDLDSIPFSAIQQSRRSANANEYVVIEEKVDGANAAISFDVQGQLLLQSRGHYLTGGSRERHFNLFKQWAHSHYASLWDVLGDRYILYGEWLYAKHTVFYDRLPHYFLEYDLLDRASGQFLSTAARRELLAGLLLASVPVLFEGKLQSHQQLVSLLQPSHFISGGHIERLRELCLEQGLNADLTIQQTNHSLLMEGLYIKVETPELTIARYKYVRADFLTTILQSDRHWLSRPIIPNQLQTSIDLFG